LAENGFYNVFLCHYGTEDIALLASRGVEKSRVEKVLTPGLSTLDLSTASNAKKADF
jgi:hypothetical protein